VRAIEYPPCIAELAKALLKEQAFVEKRQYVRTDVELANIYYVFVHRKGDEKEHGIQVGPNLPAYYKDKNKRPILEEHLRSGFVRLLRQ
jgi:hypothetical protein